MTLFFILFILHVAMTIQTAIYQGEEQMGIIWARFGLFLFTALIALQIREKIKEALKRSAKKPHLYSSFIRSDISRGF